MVAFANDEVEKLSFILAVATGKKSGATKRKYARLPLEMQVRWRLADSVEHHDGHLRDISVGGAQLVTDETLAPGTELVLELIAPGGAQPISIAGRISNAKADAYGLSFLYRQGGGSRRLKEVVRRLVDSRLT